MQLIKLFFLTYFTLAENLRDLDEEVDRVRRDEEGKIYENLLSNLSNYTNLIKLNNSSPRFLKKKNTFYFDIFSSEN